MTFDYLAMLLSLDWFSPYWAVIGMDVDDAAKERIQAGCREIVSEFMGDRKSYYYIVFSEERRSKTASQFIELTERHGVHDLLSKLTVDGADCPRDGIYSMIMLGILTSTLQGAGRVPELTLSPNIYIAVVEANLEVTTEPIEFDEIADASSSAWDSYVRHIFVDPPNVLANILKPIMAERRLRLLWNRLSRRLTLLQRQELLAWYRTVANLRGIPDNPVPYYITG